MAKNAEEILSDSSGPDTSMLSAVPEAENKASQREVDYRPADGEEKCSECSFFIPSRKFGTCKQVVGTIDPNYVCDLYQDAIPDGDMMDQMFGGNS
jgi:hypothetical protein